jgi:hypothetical protein
VLDGWWLKETCTPCLALQGPQCVQPILLTLPLLLVLSMVQVMVDCQQQVL